MGYRIFSNEGTKLAYDGTPEAPREDHRDELAGRDIPAGMPRQGLPDGHPAGTRSVLSPGMNDVSDNEYALLARDANFVAHLKAGYLSFVDDEGRAIDPPEPPEYKPDPVANSAARAVVNAGAETLPGVRTDAHAVLTGDRTNTETGEGAVPVKGEKVPGGNKQVEDFFSLNAEERSAMFPALSAEEQAVVSADPRYQGGGVIGAGEPGAANPTVTTAPLKGQPEGSTVTAQPVQPQQAARPKAGR